MELQFCLWCILTIIMLVLGVYVVVMIGYFAAANEERNRHDE